MMIKTHGGEYLNTDRIIKMFIVRESGDRWHIRAIMTDSEISYLGGFESEGEANAALFELLPEIKTVREER